MAVHRRHFPPTQLKQPRNGGYQVDGTSIDGDGLMADDGSGRDIGGQDNDFRNSENWTLGRGRIPGTPGDD